MKLETFRFAVKHKTCFIFGCELLWIQFNLISIQVPMGAPAQPPVILWLRWTVDNEECYMDYM